MLNNYPVTFVDKGPILAQHCLVDVNGIELRDPDGNPLNVHSRFLKNALERGDIHIYHTLLPGYRYIVTHPYDCKQFADDRAYGAADPYTTYYVYKDDDFDADTGRRLHRYVVWRQEHNRRQ